MKAEVVVVALLTFLFFDREVLQSGSGVNFISVRRILGKLPGNFSANFVGEFFSANCSALFSQDFSPPPPQQKKVTPKIHAQNCRHSSPISFLHAGFLLTVTGEINSFIGKSRPKVHLNLCKTWENKSLLAPISGKKKAHKHKSFWPVTPPVTRGSPDREARGQSFMCYPRNPRNINLFVRIPDREDR